MSDKINEAIKDIAVRHGVVLSKDDPVLILQTMNERLLEENRKAQQEMLAQLKEEMENISSQWKDDAKDKAEKVLNAALAGSKEAMAKLFQETTNQSVHVMKEMIFNSLVEARNLKQQTRKYSQLALLSSIAIAAILCFLLLHLLVNSLNLV
ncbi:TPA: conjugal transfer protein TraM [Legionella pneumophila]|nr:conjugal transfer protein TraM [Legionella pneumophila]HAT7919953.1 conjugal transfer protein TraM [Legionella pneumophila]HAT7924306.1 conjugal transfer protein TraM [Legionella pneumophila]HAT7934239.1 conjugal transfer protein TraM [Legionella pneumophila]HAT8808766.1 conjugal transfer protein TraM [Legionella pneumophila]